MPDMQANPMQDRPTRRAIAHGFRRRCPHCGQGDVFDGYLSVAPACPACGLDLSHARTDDGPAYMTIVIVGHIVVPPMPWAIATWSPDPLIVTVVFSAVALALTLWLLPRVKGALLGLQWAKRFHGF